MIANYNPLKQKPIIADQPVRKVRVPEPVSGHQSQAEDIDPVFLGVVQHHGYSIIDADVSRHTALLLQETMPTVNFKPMTAPSATWQESTTYFTAEDNETSTLSIIDEEITDYTARLFG
ncbi:MAG: hypothetical protein KDJ52_16135 [Anaerolineae bacterium]|nr:hypothetical protein [Anaerolineae bacterium]